MPSFMPLLLLSGAGSSITAPILVVQLLFTFLVHKPCIQCTVLFGLTLTGLCLSGLGQYCVLSLPAALSALSGANNSVCGANGTMCA